MRDMNEREALLLQAFETFGAESRFLLLMEECAELIKACSKRLRGDCSRESLSNFAEEMADVEIVMDQLKTQFGESVRLWKTVKLKRLKEMIDAIQEKKRDG
jgi:NTP pyrophosphatase (non-canonical NTP hydrolase)